MKSLLEGDRDLGKCFGIFHEIHKLIRTSDNLQRVVMEVLEDFMADNVIYLELRSTPRTLEGNILVKINTSSIFASDMRYDKFSHLLNTDGTTQLEYTEMIISVIEAHNLRHGDTMTVRLLLSIDRSKSIDENAEVLDIAFRLSSRSNVIVGIDFSGNPHNGRFADFVSLLNTCRDIGLFITVHAAEILDSRCTDTLESRKNESFASTCNKVEQEVGVCTDVLILFEPTSGTSEMDDIIAFR